MGYSFDGATKRISLTAGTTSVSVRDLWSRWVDWCLTGDNSKYLPAFVTLGGDDIDAVAGTKVSVYAFLQNGWKLKPQEADHTLNVQDGILLVSGGGDPFVNTSGDYVVRVNYQQPVQAISFSSEGGGGGGLTTDQAASLAHIEAMLAEVHQMNALDAAAPVTHAPGTISVGDIVIDLSGDNVNSRTRTRRPA
jgi:hypothetical protein